MDKKISRFVIGVRSENNSPELSDYQHIKGLRESALWKSCHDLRGVGLIRCIESWFDGDTLEKIFEDGENIIDSKGGLEKMRAIVLPQSTPLNRTIPSDDGLFLAIEKINSHMGRGWFNCDETSIHVRVCVYPSHDSVTSLISDLLLEISIANSRPFKPIIQSAINSIGRVRFYRSKVEFLLEKAQLDDTFNLDTRFGKIDLDCRYVCFSSLFKKEDHNEFIYKVIGLWEEFLINTVRHNY